MVVEMITKQDLQELRELLLEDIKQYLNTGQDTQQKEWLRSSEARKLLNISPGTLQNLRISGHLKPTKIGGTYYYNRIEIMQLLSGDTLVKTVRL